MSENITQPPGRTENSQNGSDYLGIEEVATSLKVSQGTVLRWIHKGKLNGFFRIGRKLLIRRSDFESFINRKVAELEN